jgi:putative aldouronate transport system permease protein
LISLRSAFHVPPLAHGPKPFANVRYDLRRNKALLAMMVPSVLYFLLFSYLPMIGIWFAFTQFNARLGIFQSPYIGLENFNYLFGSGTALAITWHTILYNFIFIIVGNTLNIFFAILMSEVAGKIVKKTSQTLMFLPYFISWVIVASFAYNLLNYDTGLVNNLLVRLGTGKVDIYSMPNIWYALIPLFFFWKTTGYSTIVYMSTIMGIPDDLFEAADLDGASFMQEIRYIILPGVRPTLIILVLMSLGGIMRGQFDLFYQLIGKASLLYSTTDIIDTYVFRALMSTGVNINRGTAAGVYQSVVGFLLIVSINAAVKKAEPEYALF